MTDMAVIQRKLDLARVLRDTLVVTRKRAGPLFGITLGLYAAFAVLVVLLSIGGAVFAPGLMKPMSGGEPTTGLAFSIIIALMAAFAVFMVPVFIIYGFQLWIAISELEGRTATAREALQIGLKRCLPLLGAALLTGLAIAFGMLFFLVPGIILSIMWAVTLPAIVERGGVFAAIQHSRDLTRGNRWRIFGLAVAIFIMMIVVQSVLTAIFGSYQPGDTLGPKTVAGSLVLIIYNWILSVLLVVGLGALYVQLRELKGGGGESVAQVFS